MPHTDKSDAFVLGGASKTYSISLKGVYCVLPSTLRSNSERSKGGYAFCIGLDDGGPAPPPTASTSPTPEGNRLRRSLSLDSKPLSSNEVDPSSTPCVTKSGEFLHVSSQPTVESIDLHCKLYVGSSARTNRPWTSALCSDDWIATTRC